MPSTLHTVLDSGAPSQTNAYITLVLVHGHLWQGGVFKKLAALASIHGVRVVALNTRGYPGSVPYSPDERAVLKKAGKKSSAAREEAVKFMRERARELHDYLVDFVQAENIVPARGQGVELKGGIVLAGWSYGSLWMLNFLAHAPSFRSPAVPLSIYIHKVIAFDGPAAFFGYEPLAGAYHAARDPDATPEGRIQLFHKWVSSYFTHGEPITPDTMMVTNAYKDLPSSLSNISPEERAEYIYEEPGKNADGSDNLIQRMCLVNDVCGVLRERVLYGATPVPDPKTAHDAFEDWAKVEFRLVFADRSLWPMVYGAYMFGKELEDAEKAERKLSRKVSIVRIRGGNHFAHWDYPEQAMKAFIGGEVEFVVPEQRHTKAML